MASHPPGTITQLKKSNANPFELIFRNGDLGKMMHAGKSNYKVLVCFFRISKWELLCLLSRKPFEKDQTPCHLKTIEENRRLSEKSHDKQKSYQR